MPVKYNAIIADTSCLILLDKIGELSILKKIFGKVVITYVVAMEFGKPLPDWISIDSPDNKSFEELLKIEVDSGEASAIALSVKLGKSLMILDDAKARKLAEKLNLHYTGTLGVLLKGKQLGLYESVKPFLLKIQQTNFRFSDRIFSDILKESNEL